MYRGTIALGDIPLRYVSSKIKKELFDGRDTWEKLGNF